MTESTELRPRRTRRKVSVLGVVGELLVTVGVVLLLYVAWQMWIGDAIYGAERNASGQALSQQWELDYETPSASASATAEPTPEPTETGSVATPVKMSEPADAERFAVMRIPRFGDDYAVEMAGGITRARTLDTIGIGHYPGTDMPGDIGNFAVAAHRTTWGKPFNRIADLHVGDAIVVETKQGWYTYRFRTLEYVKPSQVDVLLAVPQQVGVEATEGYLTMTSCSPMYAMTERIVAYSVFESFTPRADGKPASLTEAAA
ncbi:class E sortase [Microbacterium fluvii]|uniref:Class E sortase n=1 Tax=Microbacterium fluvii TaxID=415215 RepID=A0ABW2HJS4_9MICO|nr:class E sortase [Microbacterium fluvii]MCU4673725.1 class E sortase [Microbacterium fluvii]